jgi:hypothetical protein
VGKEWGFARGWGCGKVGAYIIRRALMWILGAGKKGRDET